MGSGVGSTGSLTDLFPGSWQLERRPGWTAGYKPESSSGLPDQSPIPVCLLPEQAPPLLMSS